MESSASLLLMVEPPRGMYTAKLDDRGRIKLPSDFLPFFNALREKRLFITSLDRKIAQIYPLAIWRENEKWFETYRDDPRIARILAFNAADLGGEADMDSQGRILFPQELRQELGIENQSVRIYAYKGRFEVLSEKVYQERRQEATQLAPDDVAKAEAAGLR